MSVSTKSPYQLQAGHKWMPGATDYIAIHQDAEGHVTAVSEAATLVRPLADNRNSWAEMEAAAINDRPAVESRLAFDNGDEVGYEHYKAKGRDKGKYLGRVFYSYGSQRRGVHRAAAGGLTISEATAIIDGAFLWAENDARLA